MLGALAGSAYVALSADYGNFRRDMRAAEREFTRFTRNMSREASVSGRNLGRGLGIAVLGTVGPLFVLGRALRASIGELQAMERENTQTAAVIESTGGIANVTAAQVEKMSQAMLQLSGVDDQVAQRGINVLLTFTKIRNETGAGNDIFNQASSALLDMVTALERGEVTGEAMSAGAIRLGRALQDPIRGVTSLRRVGVAFSADQEALIKRLAETGHVVAAQKILLQELNTEFGGSAQAAGQTFTGALNRLKEAAQGTGAAFLQTLTPMIVENAGELEKWFTKFRDNKEMQEHFRKDVEDIAGAVKDLATTANDVADALGGWGNAIKILVAYKFAAVILGWIKWIKVYKAETKSAAIWTGVLAAAQQSTGFFAPIPGMPKGFPGGGKGPTVGGRIGQMLSRLVPFLAAAAPSLATAGAADVGAILVTPGASGAGEGSRRAQKAKLFNGEYADQYPYLTIVAAKVARGRGTPEEIAFMHAMGEPPWSAGKLHALERHARILEGRPEGMGHPQGHAPPPPRKVDLSSLMPKTQLSVGTQRAIIQASRTPQTDVDDLRALQRAHRELQKMLRQDDLTGAERNQLLQDIADNEQRQRDIYSTRARAAKDARDKAAQAAKDRRDAARQARLNAHENTKWILERAVSRDEEQAGYEKDIKDLIRLRNYYRRWLAQQKKGTADYRDAKDDLDSANQRLAAARASQKDARTANKMWVIERHISLAEATDSFADDERWLRKKIALLKKIRAGQKRFSDAWKETQTAIDDANKQIIEGRKRMAASKDQGDPFAMLNEYLRIQADYGPNFFQPGGPGGFGGPGTIGGRDKLRQVSGGFEEPRGGGKTVVVNQHFPTAPTDYHREARYVQFASQAVMDG